MALENDTVNRLIAQLEADRQAYLSSQNKLQEALVNILNRQPAQPETFHPPQFARRLTVGSAEDPNLPRRPTSLTSRRTNSIGVDSTDKTLASSRKSYVVDEAGRKVLSVYSADDSSDSDDDESFYATEHLSCESYSEDDLRQHIRNYDFEPHARLIFGPLRRSEKLYSQNGLFSCDASDLSDANHTTADIYEVGEDGAPLKRSRADVHNGDSATWEVLSSLNNDKDRRQAVGRIVLLREPTPLLYGALHLAMNPHFDMDSIYRMLIDDHQRTKAYINGHQDTDDRRQRSIVFCFKYHTMVGEGREPLLWQNHDDDIGTKDGNIPISTCSSVVALSLSGSPEKTFRRHSRRTTRPEISHVYDPFAPWHVISVQNFPDWHSEVNLHETHHHYVNGPDAFLVTLLHEYRDAAKRFKELANQITSLTKPPHRAIFDSSLRDELIFESGDFVYTRRYFWASQTLGILAEEIGLMINAYRDTFTDELWSGEHRTLFPGKADKSARFANWRKKMTHTRRLFECEIEALREIQRFINREQKEIKSLREWLFSGTSVAESRQGVKQALITVEQGYNIKLLTLVTIFFLPLMFVTSVFGMTNMPENDDYVPAITMALAICLPTYLLIAVINSPEKFQKGIAWILWPWVLVWTWTKRSNEYATDYTKYYKEKYLRRKKLRQGEKAAKRSGFMAFASGGTGRGWGRAATFASLDARLEQESKLASGRRGSRAFAFAQPSDVDVPSERTKVEWKYDGRAPATLGGMATPPPLPSSATANSRGVVSALTYRPPAPLQRESTVRFDADSFKPKERRDTSLGSTPEPSPNASVGNLDQIMQDTMAVESEAPTVSVRLPPAVIVPEIQITAVTEQVATPRSPTRPNFLRRISSKLGNTGDAAGKASQV